MGRPRKNPAIKAEEVSVETVKDTLEPAEVTVSTKEKGDTYKLTAEHEGKDEKGRIVLVTHSSEGESVRELLENLLFPTGINCLVTVRVHHRGKELERAIAPHNARLMLEQKNTNVFDKIFRGF